MDPFTHLINLVAGFLVGGVGPVVAIYMLVLAVKAVDRVWRRRAVPKPSPWRQKAS